MKRQKAKRRVGGQKGNQNASRYKREYVGVAQRLAQRGLIEEEVAEIIGIADRTIRLWKHAHPEFDQALKIGKEPADHRAEFSLYKRAIGFMGPDGRYYPPDVTALIFWLKNRRPDEWRDRREWMPAPPAELPAPGEEVDLSNITLDDARRIAWLLRDRSVETMN